MGLCYSLRPRLFGDLSGSISNATSDSDQPPDAAVPTRAGGARQEDTGGCGESSSLRGGGGPVRPGDPARLPAGEHRRGDTGTDGVLIQNGGGGGGGGGGSGKGTGKDRGRRLQLLQKTSTQKQKNWDKLLVEEKEAEKEAKKVSKNIDRALKELKREYKQTHRLLLLGRLCTSVLLLLDCFIIRHTNGGYWPFHKLCHYSAEAHCHICWFGCEDYPLRLSMTNDEDGRVDSMGLLSCYSYMGSHNESRKANST